MLRASLHTGQVLPLSRALPSYADPLALYAALCDQGRKPDTMLMESADATTKSGLRSILITHAAIRASCEGHTVTLEALTLNGRHALDAVEAKVSALSLSAERLATTLTLKCPPAPAQGSERERLKAPSVLDALRALAMGWELVSRPASLGLLIGGVFSYDLLGLFEPLPEAAHDPLGYPEFSFILPEAMIILDHQRHTAQALAFVYGGPGYEPCYHDASERVSALVAAIEAATPQRQAKAPDLSPHLDPIKPRVDMSDEAFAQGVAALKSHILAGDVFQIVASRTFTAPCPDALAAYAALRALNPSPYMFFVAGQPHTIFGASPETCLKISGQQPRYVEIRPIAGTRRRGQDPDTDARVEAELRMDTKELAEHMMLVDLARNDVARVSRPGTRQVTQLLGVERYSHVMHLVSHVRGELEPELDALHAYVASMNMGTLVGAPKIRAAQLLRQVEPTRRGPYGGAVGYLTCDGELDTAIIIRSAVVRGGAAYVRAGAGVVHDSDPVAEADETSRKAAAVLKALAIVNASKQEVAP